LLAGGGDAGEEDLAGVTVFREDGGGEDGGGGCGGGTGGAGLDAERGIVAG